MKGKYISTSLLLAIRTSAKSRQDITLPETKAATENHELIWQKSALSVKELRGRMQGRDELKIA